MIKNSILRPDAKLFLLANFHNLILKPILINFSQSTSMSKGFDDVNQIRDTIISDVNEIIKKCIQNQERVGADGLVSGHSVMKVIDNNWQSLKTTRLEVWG